MGDPSLQQKEVHVSLLGDTAEHLKKGLGNCVESEQQQQQQQQCSELLRH